VTETIDVFRAVADETRRAILDLLEKGERTVNDLVACFRISQPAVSKHLRVLREAGLVRARKEGRRRVYSLRARRLREIADWVEHYERLWAEKMDALGGKKLRDHLGGGEEADESRCMGPTTRFWALLSTRFTKGK